MKLFKKLFTTLTLLFVLFVSLTGCASAPSDMVGKYNLTSLSGVPGVTASMYDYNYIILNDDYTYKIENKFQGIVTKQEGEWEVNDDKTEITFITKNGSASMEEVYDYDNEAKTITISMSASGYTLKMVLTLESPSE